MLAFPERERMESVKYWINHSSEVKENHIANFEYDCCSNAFRRTVIAVVVSLRLWARDHGANSDTDMKHRREIQRELRTKCWPTNPTLISRRNVALSETILADGKTKCPTNCGRSVDESKRRVEAPYRHNEHAKFTNLNCSNGTLHELYMNSVRANSIHELSKRCVRSAERQIRPLVHLAEAA